MTILVVYVCGLAFLYKVCVCVLLLCYFLVTLDVGLCIFSAKLKYDKQIMEQSLVKLIKLMEKIHDQHS